MIKWLDRLLTRMGRKFAYVDMYGDVRFYRYYIFFLEKHIDNGWKARLLPNLFVHYFPGEPGGEGPDIEQQHFHPWNTLSFVLRGGYTHEVGTEVRTVKAPCVSFLRGEEPHKITHMTPGTFTFFFHGKRKHGWLVDDRHCKQLCPTCAKLNDNKCVRTGVIRPIAPENELAIPSAEAQGWRKAKWIRVDDGFPALIAERKAALRKAGAVVPERSSEKFQILKEREIIEQRKEYA